MEETEKNVEHSAAHKSTGTTMVEAFRAFHAGDLSTFDTMMYAGAGIYGKKELDAISNEKMRLYMMTMFYQTMERIDIASDGNAVDRVGYPPMFVRAFEDEKNWPNRYWSNVRQTIAALEVSNFVNNDRVSRAKDQINLVRKRHNFASVAGPLHSWLREHAPNLVSPPLVSTGANFTQIGANCFSNAVIYSIFATTQAFDALLVDGKRYNSELVPSLEVTFPSKQLDFSVKRDNITQLSAENAGQEENAYRTLDIAREGVRQFIAEKIVEPLRKGTVDVKMTNCQLANQIVNVAGKHLSETYPELLGDLYADDFRIFAMTAEQKKDAVKALQAERGAKRNQMAINLYDNENRDAADFADAFLNLFPDAQRTMYNTKTWQIKFKRPAGVVIADKSADKSLVIHVKLPKSNGPHQLLSLVAQYYEFSRPEGAVVRKNPNDPASLITLLPDTLIVKNVPLVAPLAFIFAVRRAVASEEEDATANRFRSDEVNAPNEFSLGDMNDAFVAQTEDLLAIKFGWPADLVTQRYRLVSTVTYTPGHYTVHVRDTEDAVWYIDPSGGEKLRLDNLLKILDPTQKASRKDLNSKTHGVTWVYEAIEFHTQRKALISAGALPTWLDFAKH